MHPRCRRPGVALPLFLVIAAAVSAGAPDAAAQERAAIPTPSAEALTPAREIIDRHIEAIGGREAILSHSSTSATGTIAIPSAGLEGTLEVFAAKPNKTLLRFTLPGLGEVQEGFDGTVGWSVSAMTGPTIMQGAELEQKKFDSDFYAELHRHDRYASMETVEKATFEGRPCYKIRLVRKGGGEDFEFYDVETGLKAGSLTTRQTPMGMVTATTVETDYRRFGKLLQATTVKQTIMGIHQVITIKEVEFDAVDPSVFDLPAPIEALVK